MTLPHDLDVALHGALGATTLDERTDASIVAAVTLEIASGSDVTDACAASAIAPGRYLALVRDNAAHGEAHRAALSIRAQLMADEPLRIARQLEAIRTGRATAPHGATLSEVASLAKTEAGLKGDSTKLTGFGLDQDASGAVRHNVVISFAPMPTHAIQAIAERGADSVSIDSPKLSGEVTAAYALSAPIADD